MKYLGQENDINNANAKTGVLLINLGTPDRPVCPGLRKYLGEFLMDPRVIEIPKLFRALLVKGIIINFRSHKSAATYREIWTEGGSPLLTNSLALGKKTAELLGPDYEVEVAMRYGNPNVANKIATLHEKGVRKIVAIPMYPQYSGSTNGSTFDAIAKAFTKQRWVPTLHFISDYYRRASYIKAIGDSISAYWEANGRNQKLLMSFHGIPKKFVTGGDPYQSQCIETAKAVSEYLNLTDDQWMIVFQSRFGAEEWLQPYCDQTLKSLPEQGIKSIDMICPGFSADCLETLEEIEGENKEYFLEAGGEKYNYIPCLNDADSHAALMAEIVNDYNEH